LKHFVRSLFLMASSVFALLSASPLAWGQAATGRAFGTVTDQQHAAVPGANVTVTNEATQVFKTTTTNDEGYFEVLDLPIGTYAVTIEHAGFTKYVTTGNKLLINESLKFEITLKIGMPTQIVTVESQATQVETQNPTIGQSVTSRPIVDLPLNGRNVLDLALLQPGVTATDPDNGGAGNVNIAGGRSDSVTYLLDGGMNNEIVGNGVVYNPNPDTIQEFRILSSNYTAEYGRNGGGIISVVTKSGTNTLHGSAFDYARNTDFDANSYFNKLEGLPVNDLKRHQFGGTLGGPITIPHVVHGKDRLFFFFGYQGQRQTSAISESDIPTFTPAELAGNFSQAVNGGPDPNVAAFLQANPFFATPNGNAAQAIIDPTKINSISAAYIKLGLIPTNPTGFISTAEPGTSNANELTGKVDLVITQKDKLAVTVGGSRNPTLTPYVHSDVPGFPELGSNNNYFGNVAYTRTFSATLLNELRFTAQRNNFSQDFPGVTLPTASQLGFGITPDLPIGPPDMDFDTGLTLGLSVQGPTDFASNVYAVTDTFTWVKGRNTWKFGAGFTAYQNNTLFDYYGNGDFFFSAGAGVGTGNSYADFVLGIPSFYFEGPNAPNNIRTKGSYGFGQDEWRVKSNFTLTLGLRYEYNSPKLDTEGRTFDVIPGFQSTRFPNAPVGLAFPGDPGAPRGLNFPDKDNFAPRFGFAWDPWNNGKTSIRGGFGIFYDILKGEDNLQFNGAPPFFSEVSANGGAPYPTVSQSNSATCCPVPYFSDPWLTAQGGINPFPSKPPSANIDFVQAGFLPWNTSESIYLVDPHLHTPYTYQYNLDIQHELARNLVAEINYVGSSSKGLTGLVDLNPMVLGTFNRVLNLMPQTNSEINNFCGGFDLGDCPYQEQPEFQNIGFASYNSLEASLTRQVADSKFLGTTYFTLAYTYSHNIDNSSGFQNRTSQVPAYNINQFRGPSDFDVRNRISFAGGWDLPFDRAWSSGPKLLTKGWSLYPIFSWQTGFPLSINANYAGGFAFPDDPGPAADGDPFLVQALFAQGVTNLQTTNPKTSTLNSSACSVPGTCRFYFNPNDFGNVLGSTPQYDPSTPCSQQNITNELPSSNCAVSNPALRTYGLPRNFFFGPGRTNLDLALAKAFPIKENFKAILRLEAFNVFNHTEFANPSVSLASPTFGQITSTADNGVTNAPGGPRILQVALRLTF
jgi:outer membrane receptor protein involved in Fe transport